MSALDKIRAGRLAQWGLYDPEAQSAATAIVARAEADGIETIRVLFADQHGVLRGKTLTTRALAGAFAAGVGVPSTLLLKDTSHRTVFPVWDSSVAVSGLPLGGAGDVLLVPDPQSFLTLPGAPHAALLLAEVRHTSGAEVPFASETVLRGAAQALAEHGYSVLFGLEVEFQVFERTDDALSHGEATMPPAPVATRNLTPGYQYLTETRYGAAEALLDKLRRMAEDLGLAPRTVEIEMGPSQFEFTFDAADALTQARRYVLFRTMVKETCHAAGLHASFMAKPHLPNAAANGWHLHQSLWDKAGRNVFVPQDDGGLTSEASHWIAGLLAHAEAACLLTNPTVNSYKRFAPYQLAPDRVLWGRDNRGAMVRALMTPGDPAARVENRVPDTSANPYFTLAAQILSGLDGLQRQLDAPPATETPYAEGATRLPQNLGAAISAFGESALFRDRLGEDVVRYLVQLKQAEWDRYLGTVSDWEQAEYFGLF